MTVVVEAAQYPSEQQLTLEYSPLQEDYGAFIPFSTYAFCFVGKLALKLALASRPSPSFYRLYASLPR